MIDGRTIQEIMRSTTRKRKDISVYFGKQTIHTTSNINLTTKSRETKNFTKSSPKNHVSLETTELSQHTCKCVNINVQIYQSHSYRFPILQLILQSLITTASQIITMPTLRRKSRIGSRNATDTSMSRLTIGRLKVKDSALVTLVRNESSPKLAHRTIQPAAANQMMQNTTAVT